MIWILHWLLVSGVWAAPSFTNLPNNRTVDENVSIGSEVFTIEVQDDAGNDLSVWWVSSPAEGSRLFSLGSVNVNESVVTTQTDIDFEQVTATLFVFTIHLVDNTSMTATNTLTLSIRDVNEAVIWNSGTYATSVPDGAVVGTTVQDPGFATTDPDVSDTVTCLMDCPGNNDFFSISPACDITVTSVYSLDAGLSDSIACVVTAIDGGYHSVNTTLTILIDDVNNYSPVFSLVSYQFTISPYDTMDTAIGAVTATDNDSGNFGDFTYSMDQSAYTTHYFKIDSTSGQISTQLEMSTCNCPLNTFSIPVHATDQGGQVGSSLVHITTGTTTTTTTTTTPPTTTTTTPITTATVKYKTFFEDRVNVVWFTVLMTLIFGTLCITTYILIKYVFLPRTARARKPRQLVLHSANYMKRLTAVKGVRNAPPPRCKLNTRIRFKCAVTTRAGEKNIQVI